MRAFCILAAILALVVARPQAGLCADGPEHLPLKVVVNSVDRGAYILLSTGDGDIMVEPQDLRAWGLIESAIDAGRLVNGFVSLKSLSPGLTFKFNEKDAALVVTVDTQLIEKQVIDLARRRAPVSFSGYVNSAYLNYDFNYSLKDHPSAHVLGIPFEVAARVSDYLAYSNFNYTKSDPQDTDRFVRLMSNVVRDDPNRSIRYILGDYAAFAPAMGTGGTFGGISISKNFSIDPYIVRYPSLNVSGVAEVDTEAKLLVEGSPVFIRNVAAGPFELLNVPSAIGGGKAALLLKDASGAEHETIIPFYISTNLLVPGTHDFSYNLGFRRKQLGLESNEYGDLTFVGFHRMGLTDKLTGGFRVEADRHNLNLGPSAVYVIDNLAELDAALAFSDRKDELGLGASLGLSMNRKGYGVRLAYRTFTRDFTKLTGDEKSNSRHELMASCSFNSRLLGSISASYSYKDKYFEANTQRVTVNYNKNIWQRINFFCSMARIWSDRDETAVTGGINCMIGSRSMFTLKFDDDIENSRAALTATYQSNTPVGEGLGYKFNIVKEESKEVNGFAQLAYNTPYNRLRAGYERSLEQNIYDAGTAGSIVFADGSLFLSRPIIDSFTIVKVPGMKDVKIKYFNQIIASTNGSGKAIVPNTISYFDNNISLDVKDMPADYIVKEYEKVVSPPYRSGSVITFDIRKVQAFEGRIYVMKNGERKPAEYAMLEITVDGKAVQNVVGRGGEFYLENLRPGIIPARLVSDGKECRFSITIPESDEMVVDLGEITCENN